jgi:hypothetical protein
MTQSLLQRLQVLAPHSGDYCQHENGIHIQTMALVLSLDYPRETPGHVLIIVLDVEILEVANYCVFFLSFFVVIKFCAVLFF